MQIYVYSLAEEEVFQLLERSDKESHELWGTHEDNRMVVFVNGEELKAFHRKNSHYSIQDNFVEEDKRKPEDRISPLRDILTASIVETNKTVGSGTRAQARVRLFVRSPEYQLLKVKNPHAIEVGSVATTDFLVVDLGEVEGWWPVRGSRWSLDEEKVCPSLYWAIWNAKKKVRIQVHTAMNFAVFTAAKTGKNGPYKLIGFDSYQYLEDAESTQRHLQKAVEYGVELRDQIAGAASLVYPLGEHIGYSNETNAAVLEAFRLLWAQSPLGGFAQTFGLD